MVVEIEKVYDEAADKLLEWIKSQPHLPLQTSKLHIYFFNYFISDCFSKKNCLTLHSMGMEDHLVYKFRIKN
jgi:hypothetical protein